MGSLLIRVFFIFGTYASLVSVIFINSSPSRPPSCAQWLLLVLATALLCLAIGYEIRLYAKRRPLLFGPDEHVKINAFMHQWISRGGRVVIFSHDLTWVDDRMAALLIDKAKRNELEIVVPKRTGRVAPLLDQLEQEGGRVYVYPELQYVPRSRFTIVNRGRTGPRVAVGSGVGDKWRIDVFSEGEDPVFAVANDLVEVVVNLERLRQTLQEDT